MQHKMEVDFEADSSLIYDN